MRSLISPVAIDLYTAKVRIFVASSSIVLSADDLYDAASEMNDDASMTADVASGSGDDDNVISASDQLLSAGAMTSVLFVHPMITVRQRRGQMLKSVAVSTLPTCFRESLVAT